MFVPYTTDIGRSTNVVASQTIVSIRNGKRWYLIVKELQRHFYQPPCTAWTKYKTRPHHRVGHTVGSGKISRWSVNKKGMPSRNTHAKRTITRCTCIDIMSLTAFGGRNQVRLMMKKQQRCRKRNVHVARSCNDHNNDPHVLHARAREYTYKVKTILRGKYCNPNPGFR